MSRCSICHGRIWPWEHLGFRVEARGRRYWHTSCAGGLDRAEIGGSSPAATHDPLAGRALSAQERQSADAAGRERS